MFQIICYLRTNKDSFLCFCPKTVKKKIKKLKRNITKRSIYFQGGEESSFSTPPLKTKLISIELNEFIFFFLSSAEMSRSKQHRGILSLDKSTHVYSSVCLFILLSNYLCLRLNLKGVVGGLAHACMWAKRWVYSHRQDGITVCCCL